MCSLMSVRCSLHSFIYCACQTANAQATDSAAKKKKKKQQDKRIPMTLDEFQQMQKEKERRRKQEGMSCDVINIRQQFNNVFSF